MARKIDLHTHILPENWPSLKERYGYGGWITMDHSCGCGGAVMRKDDGTHFRDVDQSVWSPEARIKDMDQAGISMQVLSTVPVMFSYWANSEDALDFSRLQNDNIASVVQKHPDRFLGMCTVPMQSPQLAAEELKRCVTELNFKCVMIGSHINDWNLDCRALDVFYKTAEELDCSIFVHPWDMALNGRMAKYWLPWLVGMPSETTTAICSILFGGVLEKFPKLKFCFAHGAGTFPYTLGRIQKGFEVRPDLCATVNQSPPSCYLGRIYADSLVMDKHALMLLKETLGEDNVMLGSDYPFPLGEGACPGKLIETLPLKPDVKEKLLWKNAAHFMGIDL